MSVAQAAPDHHEYDQIGVMNNDFEMRLCIKLYSGNGISGDAELQKSSRRFYESLIQFSSVLMGAAGVESSVGSWFRRTTNFSPSTRIFTFSCGLTPPSINSIAKGSRMTF